MRSIAIRHHPHLLRACSCPSQVMYFHVNWPQFLMFAIPIGVLAQQAGFRFLSQLKDSNSPRRMQANSPRRMQANTLAQ